MKRNDVRIQADIHLEDPSDGGKSVRHDIKKFKDDDECQTKSIESFLLCMIFNYR